jgi:hypothetical protein
MLVWNADLIFLFQKTSHLRIEVFGTLTFTALSVAILNPFLRSVGKLGPLSLSKM